MSNTNNNNGKTADDIAMNVTREKNLRKLINDIALVSFDDLKTDIENASIGRHRYHTWL